MPLRPGPLLLRTRRVRIKAAAGALVAARVQDEALPLRRLGVPLLCGRPLPVRAHGPRAGVPRLRTESRVCDDASRRERRRRPRARRRVVPMMWTRSTPSTRRRRVAPMARDPLDTTDAGRGAPVPAAAAGEDAGQEVQDAHVPLRRGHVPLRRELLLRAQRRCFPRGTQNSLRAVDAKAGRSARRRSSGRSSPTSRRASRPTS